METETNNPDVSTVGRVFISYATPNRKEAIALEDYLNRHGINTFRDQSDIRVGSDWDTRIDEELRACARMVLLLSKHSMPYRREVHREWFFFDQNEKPLYPMLLEVCDRQSRMYLYNHIDATASFDLALEHLLRELCHPEYQKPEKRSLADQIVVLENCDVEKRELSVALDAIEKAVTDLTTDVVLSVDEAKRVHDHIAADERGYRLRTIAGWSMPRYKLIGRFVNLTLLLDQGTEAPERWKEQNFQFTDLRDVLAKTVEHPAIVLLGAPGSGKSTLLRRLQLDHSIDQLRSKGHEYSYFIELNSYRAAQGQPLPLPGEWLAAKWREEYPKLPPLADCLREGRVLLLLDALNEMPHRDENHYFELVGLWRDFTREASRNGNRIVYSCRSLDYSALLSNKDFPVPQVNLQSMTNDQVQQFLKAYLPASHGEIWGQLAGTDQLAIYRTPYLLSLLCDQVGKSNEIPSGRSGLFTSYVRESLRREFSSNKLLSPEIGLLDADDRSKLSNREWKSPFDLPESGPLFRQLSSLAYGMQSRGFGAPIQRKTGIARMLEKLAGKQDVQVGSKAAQIRLSYNEAINQLQHKDAESIVTAAISMNILDRNKRLDLDLAFFHQLLQEYFAARQLAREPNASLVHVEHEVGKVAEPIEKTISQLAAGDPLPPLPQTGWEETTVTAAPMAREPVGFIRALMPHNLPLAARCAASPEIKESPALVELRNDIRRQLIERTRSMKVDLRARIAAGEALGVIG
ncbi:MAG: TIR domain-containing protein, partial [Blastocatellia bacterium]